MKAEKKTICGVCAMRGYSEVRWAEAGGKYLDADGQCVEAIGDVGFRPVVRLCPGGISAEVIIAKASSTIPLITLPSNASN